MVLRTPHASDETSAHLRSITSASNSSTTFTQVSIGNMPKFDSRFDDRTSDFSSAFGSTVRAKQKIKSLEHFLKRDDLKADLRIDRERALKALKADLKNTKLKLKTQRLAKKYRMVRFFEKKKAIRKLKQAEKAYNAALEAGVKKDIKKARRVRFHCQVDVAYVIMFPKSEKYIALYPTGPVATEVEDENVKKGMILTDAQRLEFKKKVEELIELDRLPFTFEDILAGKQIEVDAFTWPRETKDVDAPEKDAAEEEDDFFE